MLAGRSGPPVVFLHGANGLPHGSVLRAAAQTAISFPSIPVRHSDQSGLAANIGDLAM